MVGFNCYSFSMGHLFNLVGKPVLRLAIFIFGALLLIIPITPVEAGPSGDGYITVEDYTPPIGPTYDAKFTAITSDYDNKNPQIHFSWDPLYALPFTNVVYRVDWISADKFPTMSADLCKKNPNAVLGEDNWRPLADHVNSSLTGNVVSSKISVDVPDARLLYTGKAYFRVVVSPNTVDTRAIACRTKPVDALFDDPASNTITIKTGDAHDGTTGKIVTATITIDGKTPAEFKRQTGIVGGTFKNDTPAVILLPKDPTSTKHYNFVFHADGYVDIRQPIRPYESWILDIKFYTDREGTVDSTPLNGRQLGGLGNSRNCNDYIFNLNIKFELGKYVACQLMTLGANLAHSITTALGTMVSTNPWDTINNKSNGITGVWWGLLGLVDVLVILGLLAAAFSNIFRFLPIKLDQYQVKQALPGIIWGIILANLSFFALRLMIETASIATQGIAEFMSSRVGVPVGGQNGGAYLLDQVYKEMAYALSNYPSNIFTSSGSYIFENGNGLELVFGSLFTLLGGVGDAVVGTLLGIIGLVLFLLTETVFFGVLLFLLFLRNYIVAVLFIVSPLAFFALGFPPLKMVWQKWWGTFWKWLLMLPATFGVVALKLQIVHSRNQAMQRSIQAGEDQNLFDYLFFNGMDIVLLYLAIRIPFMWGQFFGTNAMERWAKGGSKAAQLAHMGTKKGTDLALDKAVRGKHGLMKYTPGYRKLHQELNVPKSIAEEDELRKRGEDLKLKWESGENVTSYTARVNAALRARRKSKISEDIGSAQKSFNLFRMPEAVQAGWKARMAGLKGLEEYDIKQNKGFGWAAGPQGVNKELYDKASEEAKSIDDYYGLEDDITKLHKHIMDKMKEAEFDDTRAKDLAAEEVRKLMNMQFGPREGYYASSEWLAGYDKKKFQQGVEKAKKWASLANRDKDMKDKYGAKTGGEAMKNFLSGVTPSTGSAGAGGGGGASPAGGVVGGAGGSGASPGGAVVGGGGGTPSGTSSGIGGSAGPGPSSTDDALYQAIDEAGKEAISQMAIDTIQRIPHAAVTAAQEAFKQSEQALRDSLEKQGVAKVQAQAVINSLFKNINQGMAGIPFNQLLEAANATVNPADTEPFVRAFSERVKGLNKTVTLASEQVSGDLPMHMGIATQMLDRGDDVAKIEADIAAVRSSLADGSPPSDSLQKQVLDLAGKLNVSSTDTSKTLKQVEGALQIVNHPEIRAIRASGDPAGYPAALKSVEQQMFMTQSAVVESAKSFDQQRALLKLQDVDPQALVNDQQFMDSVKNRLLTSIVASSGTARDHYYSSETKQAATEAAVTQGAKQLVEHFNTLASGEASVRDAIVADPDKLTAIRNSIVQNVGSELFKADGTPTEQLSQVAAPTPNQDNG